MTTSDVHVPPASFENRHTSRRGVAMPLASSTPAHERPITDVAGSLVERLFVDRRIDRFADPARELIARDPHRPNQGRPERHLAGPPAPSRPQRPSHRLLDRSVRTGSHRGTGRTSCGAAPGRTGCAERAAHCARGRSRLGRHDRWASQDRPGACRGQRLGARARRTLVECAATRPTGDGGSCGLCRSNGRDGGRLPRRTSPRTTRHRRGQHRVRASAEDLDSRRRTLRARRHCAPSRRGRYRCRARPAR